MKPARKIARMAAKPPKSERPSNRADRRKAGQVRGLRIKPALCHGSKPRASLYTHVGVPTMVRGRLRNRRLGPDTVGRMSSKAAA